MKKLIVLICMVLCVAVIGSVLAIAVYDATAVTDTIGTDGHIYLSINTEDNVENFTLEKGIPTVVAITFGVGKNSSEWGSTVAGKLTINVEKNGDKVLDNIEYGFYSDSNATQPMTDETTEKNTFVKSNITAETTTVYVRLFLKADATQTEVTAAGGKLVCSFVDMAYTPAEQA